MLALALFCLVIVPGSGQALGTATLLKNINTTELVAFNGSGLPGIPDGSPMVALGNRLLFVNKNPPHRAGLWVSDGTQAGTQMIYDNAPDSVNTGQESLVVLGERAFFLAGYNLWVTDGTTSGTTIFRSLQNGGPPSTNGSPRIFAATNQLFFTAFDHEIPSLWRTDGTEAGTIKLYEGVSLTEFHSTVGSILYWTQQAFSVTTLWKSDGTPAGTGPIAQIDAPLALYLSSGAALGNTLYFFANGTSGAALWKSDGTPAGTSAVKSFTNPRNLVSTGTTLFFVTSETTPPASQTLWRSNGTAAGSQIVTSYSATYTTIANMQTIGERLFFSDPSGQVNALSGTTIEPLGTATLGPYRTTNFVDLNGSVFFLAADQLGTARLWKTDGSSAGTQAITSAGGRNLMVVGQRLHFVQSAGSFAPQLLWQSDGTQVGTLPTQAAVRYEASLNAGVTFLPRLMPVGSSLYFAANDSSHGTELWQSDGSSVGTHMLADLRADSGINAPGSRPTELIENQGRLLFFANDGRGPALWASDGSIASTQIIKLFTGETDAARMTRLGDELYFMTGRQVMFGSVNTLWYSDGTASGTQPYSTTLSIEEYLIAGETIFLRARPAADPKLGLWTIDRTTQESQLLTDLVTPMTMVGNNGNLFFLAQSSINYQYSLWKSNGTPAGTQFVADIFGGVNTKPDYFTMVGNQVFFTTTTWANGEELWVSDGTNAGTHMVRNIAADGPNQWEVNSSSPRYLTAIGDHLIFSADDAIHGRELWISDGSEQDTRMVKDIRPGLIGGLSATADPTVVRPVSWPVIDGSVVFAANDGLLGIELWRTDGTTLGTQQLTDIVAGPGSSHPSGSILLGNDLFFIADDGTTGMEIWKLQWKDSPLPRPLRYTSNLPFVIGP